MNEAFSIRGWLCGNDTVLRERDKERCRVFRIEINVGDPASETNHLSLIRSKEWGLFYKGIAFGNGTDVEGANWVMLRKSDIKGQELYKDNFVLTKYLSSIDTDTEKGNPM